MFSHSASQNRSAFLPYFPIGWPSVAESLDAIQEMAEAGADGFEIGIPFSDPLADGPVIQAATQKALENGVTVRGCIEAVRELRGRGVHQPMLLMGYVNPLLTYGPKQFVADAKEAGVDGIIIPDLPPEEGDEWVKLCAKANIALVFLLAPTSTQARINLVTDQSTGFIYVVSLTGVTGARTALPEGLEAFLAGVKVEAGDLPLVLGFGIATPEHAQRVNGLTEGFIVGSALVRAAQDGPDAAIALAREIVEAIGGGTVSV
ncbi:MAG: tryptophan synthase subunit alpha [Anaerolineae bacterium]